MSRVTRIAVSLPRELLRVVEQERRATGESRSEYVRRALIALVDAKKRRGALERYVRGYSAVPETPEEVAAEGGLGEVSLAEEPWK